MKKKKILWIVLALLLAAAVCALILSCPDSGGRDTDTAGQQTEAGAAAEEKVSGAEKNMGKAGGKPDDRESGSSDSVPGTPDSYPEDSAGPVTVDPDSAVPPYTDIDRFNDMSGAEQSAFIDSFESKEAFINWYNEAMEYSAENRGDIVIDGSTDIQFGE